jgi:Flp pilus assembly protein TadD
LGAALLGAGLFLASGAAAQQSGVTRGSSASDGVDAALSNNLRLLAQNPTSLIALMGAGRASLEGGDTQAALNFFARAEEIAPKDGRIKMWIGSALVQLEQPRPALRFFDEARALGVPEADLAGNRGLVYDMLGDPRRAQQDYELALRHGRDAEVTRRLALSFGISGDRERALQLLEEQLLVRDPAAARTRALVLALTGDSEGADRAAQEAMPGAQGQAMAPFLARLPTLSLADRALAVHFGHFPGSGQPASTSYAAITPITDAGAPDTARPALGTPGKPAASGTNASRRRPDGGSAMASVSPGASGTSIPSNSRTPAPGAQTSRSSIASTSALSPAPRQVAEVSRPVPHAATRDSAPISRPAEAAGRLASVAAALAELSDERAATRADQPSRSAGGGASARASLPTASTSASTRTARAAPAKKPASPPPPHEPSRVWVQIAGGANAGSFPREYARLKAKAPKLLSARSPWTVPANATNRLLVGPFANGHDAQAFINDLAKDGVSGFAWTSAAGQRIERLPAR